MFGFGWNNHGQLGMETENWIQYEPSEGQFKSPISKIYAVANQSFIFE